MLLPCVLAVTEKIMKSLTVSTLSCWLVASAVAIGVGVGVLAQEPDAPGETAAKQEVQTATRSTCVPCRVAPELTRGAMARQSNPLEVCEVLFDLSEEQRELLNELAAEHELEQNRRISELAEQYAERAKVLLSEREGAQLAGVVKALEKFRGAIAEATAELTAAGGPGFALQARKNPIPRGEALLEYVGLTTQQDKELDRLREEKSRAIREETRALARPAAGDKVASAKYSREHRAIYAKADAQFEEEVAKLLSAVQKEKLARIEEGVNRFAEKKRNAEQEFKRELTQAMRAN